MQLLALFQVVWPPFWPSKVLFEAEFENNDQFDPSFAYPEEKNICEYPAAFSLPVAADIFECPTAQFLNLKMINLSEKLSKSP